MNKLFLSIFVTLSLEGFSQFDKLGENTPWNKGSINLSNGGKLLGFIQNNERLHLIRFKASLSDDDDSRLLNEQDIVLMEYYDSQSKTARRFASINYTAKDLPQSLSGKKSHLM